MNISKILFSAILIQILIISNTAPILEAEQSEDRLNERLAIGMKNKNKMSDQKMIDVSATEGFKYFSGNTFPIHNHPAIYAGDAKLFVVGYKYSREFPVSQLSEAIKAYRELLILDGYLDKNQ